MRDDVITVGRKTTLKEAVELMLIKKTNALVVAEESKLVGILTSWRIIEKIVPDYLEDDKHLASFEAQDLFQRRILELSGMPVEEFMSADVVTVKPDASLIQASTLISEHHIRQLPVMDDNNKLVGYINHTDIKRAVGQVLGFDNKILK